MKEIWKDIPKWEGMYQVSNLGRVKSLKRKNVLKERIKKSCKGIYGYTHVILWKNSIGKTYKIHKLVQKSFRMKDGQIDHINDIKHDNRLINLRTCTPSQNSANIKKHRGNSKYKGVHKLKNRDVWISLIYKNRKVYPLGRFKKEKEAAMAYDKAAANMFGEFARLNFANND